MPATTLPTPVRFERSHARTGAWTAFALNLTASVGFVVYREATFALWVLVAAGLSCATAGAGLLLSTRPPAQHFGRGLVRGTLVSLVVMLIGLVAGVAQSISIGS